MNWVALSLARQELPVALHQVRWPSCFFLQELSKVGLGSDMQVELRILQLPVDYREVKQKVARIWEDLQPQVNDS